MFPFHWRISTFSFACILYVIPVTSEGGSHVTVTTRLGDVIGRRLLVDGEKVLQFLKIPFAQPPINTLRFRKPVPVSGWSKPLLATEYGPSCSQNHLDDNLPFLFDKNLNTSEDCLHLNIYIPGEGINTESKLPVLVWIHGGAFLWGQAMRNDGSRLALGGDVIVITVNYRLGAFGFLSIDNPNLRGNYGLWDVHMSLKWIRDNVASFGGDPSQVGVFGESSGGFAVSSLVIAPVNKGLFKRAIIMSGPLFSPLTLSKSSKVRGFSARFIQNVNCSGDGEEIDMDYTMACLRNMDAKTAVDVTDRLMIKERFEVLIAELGPVVDYDFIPDTVNKLLNNKSSEAYKWFNSLDIMIGNTDAEGTLIHYSLAPFQKQFNFDITVGIPRRVLCDYVIPAVVRDFFNDAKGIRNEMCAFYSTNLDSSDQQSHMALNLVTDMLFWAPTLQFISAHISSSIQTFLYLFSLRYGITQFRTDHGMTWVRGANHGDEVYIVFGPQYIYPRNTEIDKTEMRLSWGMMQYWANFVKYGNPNGDPSKPTSLVHWPKYDEEEKYINFNSTISAEKSIFSKRMKFWLERIPELLREAANVANFVGGLTHASICATIAYLFICFI